MKATIEIDTERGKVWDHAYPGQAVWDAAKAAQAAGYQTLIFNGWFYLVNGGDPIKTELKERDVYRTGMEFLFSVPERDVDSVKSALKRLLANTTDVYLQDVKVISWAEVDL